MSETISVQQGPQKFSSEDGRLSTSNYSLSQNAGTVPMSLDRAIAEPSSPSYFHSLEALLYASLAPSDNIIRSAAGGYMTTSGVTQRPSQKSPEQNNLHAEIQMGLGLFNPRFFMGNAKDSGKDSDAEDDGRSQSGQQPARISTTQVSLMTQLMQAQQLLSQAREGRLLAPINQDGVQFQGVTPENIANSFHELMHELVHALAKELNERSEASGRAVADPLQLLSQVPNGSSATPPNIQDLRKLLEDAVSLHLLQQTQSSGASPEKTDALDASRQMLMLLADKIRGGDLQGNPALLGTLLEALQGIMQLQPNLAKTGMGDQLKAIKSAFMSLGAQNSSAAANPVARVAPSLGLAGLTAPEATALPTPLSPEPSNLLSSEDVGWKPVGDKALEMNPLKTLDTSKQYSTVASGSVDASGAMTGAGIGQGGIDSFAYRLKPNEHGDISILTASLSGKASGDGFMVKGKMALDDTGKPTAFSEGVISWGDGTERIRMNSDGIGEFTNNGGKSWTTLLNGEGSQYSTKGEKYVVSYSPIDRKVEFLWQNQGRREGSATITADGSSVGFMNLSTQSAATIG